MKCKYMQKGECTNIQSLFKGCNAVWCCICSLKEPERCDFIIQKVYVDITYLIVIESVRDMICVRYIEY